MYFLLGCASVEDSTEHSDSGGLATGDCDGSVEASVESTEVATAPRIRFSTPGDSVARVVFDNGEGNARHTDPDGGGTEHDPVLIGILPEETFSYRVEVKGDGGYRCVAFGEGENGALPSGMPEWTMDIADAGGAVEGLNVVPIITDASPPGGWLMVVDEQGRAVWAVNTTEGNTDAVGTRAYLARARDGFLLNSPASAADSDSFFRHIAFDGTSTVVATVPGAHTDFVELPEGKIAYIGWEIRSFDEQTLLGDHVSVVDASGNIETLWRSFDNVELDLTEVWSTGFYVADATVGDWSHVNGIGYDDESGDLFVTMTVWDGAARIDGTTGAQEWFLGDGWSDFTYPTDLPLTSRPHSIRLLSPDTFLVFNRGDPVGASGCSYANEIGLDTTTRVATELSHLEGSEGCTSVSFYGHAERLANGNTMLDFSSSGRLDEVTPADETIWSMAFQAGSAIGFTSRFEPLPE